MAAHEQIITRDRATVTATREVDQEGADDETDRGEHGAEEQTDATFAVTTTAPISNLTKSSATTSSVARPAAVAASVDPAIDRPAHVAPARRTW
nr:hypothetical protein [Actinokineospora iranica]